jgi:hypothetical protein
MRRIRGILITIMMISAAMMARATYNILNEIQLERQKTTSDDYARDRVVLLKGKHGQCTGVQVRAASGLVYTLTAAHCEAILEDGQAESTLENGATKTVIEIEVDRTADLMLMTAVSSDYLPVAGDVHRYDHVHTMTHGNGLPTYRTDGTALKDDDILIMLFPINTVEDLEKCQENPTQEMSPITPQQILGGEIPVCLKRLHSMVATAQVIPGSSGGPLLNEENQIIGIASASAPGSPISFFVTLEDIHKFLAGR